MTAANLHDAGVIEVFVALSDVYGSDADNNPVEEKIAMLHWCADELMNPFKNQIGMS